MFGRIIHRPVLAIVISVFILFAGGLAIKLLPISQFPQIAPTTVSIFIAYPGSSAKVLVNSTLIPLEQAINGVPGMRYISSDATSAGEATINVIFEPGTDPNQAVVAVKTRVDQVMPLLPPLVQREGVIISPIQPSMLMYVNLYSKNADADQKFLYNYANVKMIPELKRIKGIGRAKILGSRQYAMRVWLKPDRMRAYNISAEEVLEAMEEQSIIGRPGRLGQSSGKQAQSLEYVLVYQDRYNKPEQYDDIIIRANEEGEIIHLKDVATVELGVEFMDIYSDLDGDPAAAIVLKQSYGSNASEVIDEVKVTLKEMEANFPPGMGYKISYDVSQFLDASIEQVISTLFDAFLLVALVVFLFLGDWRSTLIPILAVPVSLVGAFFVLQLFGLSINLITLFALVLSIGIVVDNAIVVVEAVHAKMEEKNVSPFEATQQVLSEISGAIIAITLVMTAVFVPIAFMSGPVGVFYRQFSITMASSIIISGIVALTLTPVLCAVLLKNTHGKPRKKSLINRFLDWFNRGFEKLTGKYVGLLRKIVNRRALTFGILLLFGVGIFMENQVLPTGFIPGEDQGTIYAIIQTPPGATLERTNKVTHELQQICEEIEDIESVSALAGYEIMTEGRGSNAGTCLINLKTWSEREHSVHEVMEELEEKSHDLGAVVEFFEPPAVPGFGSSGGFSMRLLDKTNSTNFQEFDKINNAFMDALREREELTGLFTFFAANYPQYELEIDNKVAMQKGVSIGKAMENLNILIGSTYEQGFIRFGRFFKVYTQAAPEYRRYPSDLTNLFVKNEHGEMVPYSSFMTLKKTQGPNEITRYNLYNSAAIRGLPAPGYTSADAIAAIREVAEETLPRGYDVGWEGLSYDEAKRGNEALYIFFIVLIFVYLVLAAQYESFLLPLAVILSLPMGIFGSFLLLHFMGLANDIYAQIGMIMLVGLLGKNAVLIVEFAVQKNRQGASVLEAAIEGARVRFRPILMTSFAFIAGLIPLVIAHGAGAIGNRTIGGASLGGMLLGTIFGVILIPGLYYIFAKLAVGRKLMKEESTEPLSEEIIEVTAQDHLLKKMLKKLAGNKLKSIVIIGILSVAIQSCKAPEQVSKVENKTVPSSFNGSQDTINSATQNWKTFFTDSNLVALIDVALRNNQELNILLQELEMARNEVRARKGEYLPSVSLNGGVGAEKVPRFTRNGAVEATTDIEPGKEFPERLPDFLLGASATWEVDIWKKLRNAKKAAVTRYLATNEGKNFMVTQLVAEIANSYYELLALDNQLEIAKQNIEIQSNVLQVVKQQKQATRVTELAVKRFEAQVLNTRGLQYEIQQKIVETENRINFLVGRFPQEVPRNGQTFGNLITDSIRVGIPMQLLVNRPDIRQAELELAAAKLDVRVVRAKFYPSVGISAGFGYQAFNPARLLESPESMLYSLMGDLTSPLINRSAIKAEYYNANARQVQTIYTYEQTILNAYIEVANQISNINNLESRYTLKELEVQALTQSIAISNNLFRSARADYMEVLLTQREALESRFELIETKMLHMHAMVDIYQALGGGWK